MYCTADDLYLQINKTSLIEFARESDDAGEEYLDRITAAIEAASAEINGYLAKQYTVPLTVIPDAIKNVCIDIAIYKIICRHGIAKDGADAIWFDRYKSAVKFLENVRDGKNDIGIMKADGESTPSDYVYKTKPKIFNERFWKGY